MNYPLYRHSRDRIRLPSGRSIEEFSTENLSASRLSEEDLGIHRDVLLAQAHIAEKHGFRQLSENLKRAAELTEVPDKELLKIYESLRPGRMSRSALCKLAETVETDYGATLTANFIREAAQIVTD